MTPNILSANCHQGFCAERTGEKKWNTNYDSCGGTILNDGENTYAIYLIICIIKSFARNVPTGFLFIYFFDAIFE